MGDGPPHAAEAALPRGFLWLGHREEAVRDAGLGVREHRPRARQADPVAWSQGLKIRWGRNRIIRISYHWNFIKILSEIIKILLAFCRT